MTATKLRLSRLEKRLTPKKAPVILFAKPGETSRECILRHGREPDDAVRYIVVSWHPGDERL